MSFISKSTALLAFLTSTLLAQSFSAAPTTSSISELRYHAQVPMGVEVLQLQPCGRTLYLLASAHHDSFQDMRRVRQGTRLTLLTPSGDPVKSYPDQLSFRITASLKENKLLEMQPYPVSAEGDPSELLLSLRFQLKVFRGLNVRVLTPNSVRIIGVPAELPYDERIYRVGFDLDAVPVEDRTVLEVLGPSGERLAKFHLELL